MTTLWPSTPSVITAILSPITFAELRVEWNSSNDKAGFGISGNPDLSGVPELRYSSSAYGDAAETGA